MRGGDLLALAALLGPWIGCGAAPPEPPAAPPPAVGAAPEAVTVETARARRGALEERIVAPGSLVARRESRIGAEITGRIDHVFVDVGDRVNAGDPLFEIDRSTYQAVLRQAEAGLELARAQARQIEADLARARGLHQEEIFSESKLEQLATRLDVARAAERQAEARVVLARQNLERTSVRAPFAGTVARRLADEGTTAITNPQTIVLVLQETAELEGHVTLPESHHRCVVVGDRAVVHVEGVPSPIETRVAAIADTIDPTTRTFLVRVPVPNPAHRLMAGIFARVEIFPRPRRHAVLVPREAIRSEAGSNTVLAVREGRAVAVPVSIGIRSERMVEVLSGLDDGDEVIVGQEARNLATGTRVRARLAGSPAA